MYSNEGPLASFKVSTYNVQTFFVRSKINLKHTVLCKISSGDVSASDILNLKAYLELDIIKNFVATFQTLYEKNSFLF